jgi:mono/diheme cytochrome c family protein
MMTRFMTFLFLFACSSINQPSRDYYQSKKTRSHGLLLVVESDKLVSKKNEIPKKLNRRSVARGRELFKNNCVVCHGNTGRGDGPESYKYLGTVADLSKLAKKEEGIRFFIKVSQSEGAMPGWQRKFSRKELDDITEYLRSLTQ